MTDPDDIDWGLLLQIARFEASFLWHDPVPEPEDENAAAPALPDGLDLHHGRDLDWVAEVVARAEARPGTADAA